MSGEDVDDVSATHRRYFPWATNSPAGRNVWVSDEMERGAEFLFGWGCAIMLSTMGNEHDGLTPMMRQYRRTKEELDANTILFFRMGDFYEMFFEDAVRAAPILGVAETKRAGVPMCGVPYHALDGYLAKVVRAGLKAAVCEQVEDPKTAKGLVRREITRIVSAGTVIEDALLDAGCNNYVAAVWADEAHEQFGVAALEMSTGECLVEGCDSMGSLVESIRRIAPSETILSEEQRETFAALYDTGILGTVTEITTWRFGFELAEETLCQQLKVHSLEGYCGRERPLWVQAAGALFHVVRHDLRRTLEHVRDLTVRQHEAYLVLDECTCRNLDLLPYPGGVKEEETLLGVLDGTCNHMGHRKLRDWIRSPLRDVEAIRARQDAVKAFIRDRKMLNAVRAVLSATRDFERVLSRLSNASGNARDLRMVADSLAQIPMLRSVLEPAEVPLLQTLREQLSEIPELTETLLAALEETPPITVKEGGLIRVGYDAALDEFRQMAQHGHAWVAQYQQQQQEATGIKTLRVRHNSVFGFYIEVSKAQLHLAPAHYERRQTLVNAERFITPELKEYETKILGAQDKANALEYEIFNRLRDMTVMHLDAIRATANAVAMVDILQGFADRALALDYVCPTVDMSQTLDIVEGRHPIVEVRQASERFVPNDTQLNGTTRQFILITGPNMAGKSTYIRQVAVLSVMAHIGSFVAAEKMTIGVMDRIFTRVGAGDELARGRSTFMVEMQETANILNNATPRSLIILDEIGRGTSTFDGISIAWSVVEYLHNTPEHKARTLFATHYHELTDLASSLAGVKNYTVQVQEDKSGIVFLRRIVAGAADKSYGIHVAQLAGLPPSVITRANTVLASLEGQKPITTELPKKRKLAPTYNDFQLGLFEA